MKLWLKKLSKLFTRYRLKTYAPYTRKHTSAKITQTLSAQFKNYCWLWFKCSLKMYLFTGIVILIETPQVFSLPFDFYFSIQFIIMIFIRTKISQSVSNYSSKSDNTWSKELCYLLPAVLSEFKTLFPISLSLSSIYHVYLEEFMELEIVRFYGSVLACVPVPLLCRNAFFLTFGLRALNQTFGWCWHCYIVHCDCFS